MKVLLFSTDEYFVRVFGDFLASRKTENDMLCYTSESAAASLLEQEKIGLILCEEGYLADYAGKIPFISLGMRTTMPNENGVASLNIYQKATNILEEYDRIASLCFGSNSIAGNGTGKVIVSYSTEGGSGKSTVSYLTAVQSAKLRKTAYWCLEPLCTSSGLYQQEFNHTMEEVLFAQKTGTGFQRVLYETLAQNSDGVFVLPGLASIGDYKEIDIEFINRMCEEMLQMGLEWIILDLPSGISKFTEDLLDMSNHIIWVFTSSKRGSSKEQDLVRDPYLKKLMGKSTIVRNACEKKEDAMGVVAGFPHSGTIRKAVNVSSVLEVNQEFAEGCNRIVQNIEQI